MARSVLIIISIACMMTGLGGPHVTNTTAKVEDRWGIQIYIQGAAGERHRLQGHESRAPGSRGGGPCGRDHAHAALLLETYLAM